MMPVAEFDTMNTNKAANPGFKFTNFLKTLVAAVVHVLKGFGHLALAVIAVAALTLKGIALSIAALLFETGLSNVVAGAAKSIFIAEECLAVVVDRLLDGGARFLNSLRTAYNTIFTAPAQKISTNKRHDALDSDAESDAEVVVNVLETENDLPTTPISPIAKQLPFFFEDTHTCQDHVHAFNSLVSHGGNEILNYYRQQKADFLSAGDFEWQKDTRPRARSNSNTVCL